MAFNFYIWVKISYFKFGKSKALTKILKYSFYMKLLDYCEKLSDDVWVF